MTRIAAMMTCLLRVVIAGAQSAVAVTAEPHHHQVYADAHVRVFSVEVPGHASTLLHQHDRDYVWVALGEAAFINAVAGKPDAPVAAADGSVHFARGGFAHVARNPGVAPFRNVTIELLEPADNPRNLCEPVLAGEPIDCPAGPAAGDAGYRGASVHPALATDRMRVSVLAIATGGTLRVAPSKNARLLIAIGDVAGPSTLACGVPGEAPSTPLRLRSGQGLVPSPLVDCAVRNGGRAAMRWVAIDFKGEMR